MKFSIFMSIVNHHLAFSSEHRHLSPIKSVISRETTPLPKISEAGRAMISQIQNESATQPKKISFQKIRIRPGNFIIKWWVSGIDSRHHYGALIAQKAVRLSRDIVLPLQLEI